MNALISWRVLILRNLECSDLAELSLAIRLEENGVLGNRANFQPEDFHLAYEGPLKAMQSGDKSPHSQGITQHQNRRGADTRARARLTS